jgi:hypothetical protein
MTRSQSTCKAGRANDSDFAVLTENIPPWTQTWCTIYLKRGHPEILSCQSSVFPIFRFFPFC